IFESSEGMDTAQIERSLNEAEREGGGDPQFWYLLGLAWRNVGRFDRAIPCLNTSIGLDRDRPETWSARGEIRIVTGEAPRAAADFDRALELAPGWDHAQRNRALARETAGDLAG